MPQLTATNIAVLNNYAAAGQRERYWSYLAALGDKYAARALEVVRNDGVIRVRFQFFRFWTRISNHHKRRANAMNNPDAT